ncbi:hypothetical protein EON67_09795 [archaeon]|nr:MAG: hypothetical protein EON67_09795 [archaeon]
MRAAVHARLAGWQPASRRAVRVCGPHGCTPAALHAASRPRRACRVACSLLSSTLTAAQSSMPRAQCVRAARIPAGREKWAPECSRGGVMNGEYNVPPPSH